MRSEKVRVRGSEVAARVQRGRKVLKIVEGGERTCLRARRARVLCVRRP